ncbi:MAG TPA: hypothetical protein VHP38_14460, partial [Ruminiclostridium sp.]|nr:hypothetical protein [Ruminiclostridium sp.]
GRDYMCRYIQTEQFLGVTFVNLLQNNLQQIKLSLFSEIEKKVDQFIRKENNAILCVSSQELYSAIDEYQDFFQVRENCIEICDRMKPRIKTTEGKEDLVEILKTYFSAGIPEDINNAVNLVLENELKNY